MSGTRDDAYERLFETVPTSVIVLDAAGRVLRLNRHASMVLGRGEDAVGTPFATLVADRDRVRASELLACSLSEATEPVELSMSSPDGERELLWHAMALTDVAGDAELLLAGQDMTEYRALQRQLRHAQKMDAIGTLASGIAHDFNNLLMGIRGCADVALAMSGKRAPARRYIAELRSAADSGSAVVAQLMELSRRVPGESKVVDLGELVAKKELMLRRLVGAHIALRIERKGSTPWVRCDPAQLDQVLLNLALNAAHAMSAGGELMIRASVQHARTRLGRLEPGRYAVLTVSDTGSGMDQRTRRRAFEPFFTTKEPGKGTGLGLSMVQAIVRQYRGRIELRSAPGQGTTITIHFPLARPRRAGKRAERARNHCGQGRTVLVVEDDALVRMTVRHYLERNGYRVLEAADGVEALQIEARHRAAIQIVVSDLVLPGTSGLELARTLLRFHPELRLVFMSAHPRAELPRQGPLACGVRMLQKPFDEADLLDVLAGPAGDRVVGDAGRTNLE